VCDKNDELKFLNHNIDYNHNIIIFGDYHSSLHSLLDNLKLLRDKKLISTSTRWSILCCFDNITNIYINNDSYI